MTPTLVLTTCGTSLLTNGASQPLRELLNETANRQRDALGPAQKQAIDQRLREQQQVMGGRSFAEARRLSAEVNGLLGFYGGQPGRGAADQHILLHTDTYAGEVVAAALEQWLRGQGIRQVWAQRAAGLNTHDARSFSHALSDLISWCEATLTDYRDKGHRVVFNLVGGFKSVQGFMQTLGMFYADEVLYIFESGGELLRIPRLPIDIEAGAREAVRRHLPQFRRLNQPGTTLPAAQCAGIPETFLYQLAGDVELSPWGKLVWERAKGPIYREGLLDPTTRRLAYKPAFKAEVAKLPIDRIELVNQRLDDLARCLEPAAAYNPPRLDFKPLRGNPRPPSTHECDAWVDGAAWRIFGHFEGDVLVLDHIGPGLH